MGQKKPVDGDEEDEEEILETLISEIVLNEK